MLRFVPVGTGFKGSVGFVVWFASKPFESLSLTNTSQLSEYVIKSAII